MIGIVDYGLGNLGSVKNMLRVAGARSIISSDHEVLANADKLILPGVGSFDAGVNNLKKRNLYDFLQSVVEAGKPILGICLGMQLLGNSSQEGNLPGLGLIDFENVRFCFPVESNLKVPHMGWDSVKIERESLLTTGLDSRQRYYFVHSYHAVCKNRNSVLMTCDYGGEFPAAVSSGVAYGVQFHPEKSHGFGMELLKNFAEGC